MSRFYDVLNHANRVYHVGDADSVLKEVLSDSEAHIQPALARDVEAVTTESRTEQASAELSASAPLLIVPANSKAEPSGFSKRIHVSVDKRARVLPNATDATVVEQYRRLRTKLVQEQATAPFRSLMVTSPSPQEGKSVTAMNLAFSFAMIPSFSVVVVDADLRRGSLSKWLECSTDEPGFSELLDGTANLEQVVLQADELPLHFILNGRSKKQPAELLNSDSVKLQIDKLAETFDLVIVDSPPVNVITDAQLIAGGCDAIIIVARAFSTTCNHLEKAVQDLQQFRILGTVLNGVSRVKRYGKYHGYY